MKVARVSSKRGFEEKLFTSVTASSAISLLLIIVGIFAVVLWGAWPALEAYGFSFLFSQIWDPVANVYGAIPLIAGTVITSLLSLAIAAPFGIGTAIFLSELAPHWLRRPASFMVELLAAVPSVVYGIWGIFVLVPWIRTGPGLFLETYLGFLPIFQGPSIGVGVLSASVLLAIMILPTIAAITREVVKTTPIELREGMYALGATRWEVISKVILPTSKIGINGAVFLAFGRAIGEAMAVTMVIGNSNIIPLSILSPAQTIASLIVNEFPEAFDLRLSSLLVLGLTLFVITLLINIFAVWLITLTKKKFNGQRARNLFSVNEVITLDLKEKIAPIK